MSADGAHILFLDNTTATAADVTVLNVEPGRKPRWKARETSGLDAGCWFSTAQVYFSVVMLGEARGAGS